MKFMSIVYASRESEKGEMPDPRLMAAIGQLGDEMLKNGTMLDTGGLAPSAAGKRVKVTGGKISITDGPFAESKEIVGGYAVLNADSIEEAERLTRRFWQLHVDILGPSFEGAGELRQLFTHEDFAR
jgi:hypothetical protein